MAERFENDRLTSSGWVLVYLPFHPEGRQSCEEVQDLHRNPVRCNGFPVLVSLSPSRGTSGFPVYSVPDAHLNRNVLRTAQVRSRPIAAA